MKPSQNKINQISWWLIASIPALGKSKKNQDESEASLGYTVRSRLAYTQNIGLPGACKIDETTESPYE